MSSLELYAGPAALQWIRHKGLDQSQVRAIIGASGGPKWFVLYGLDRYLCGNFLAGRTQPLPMLGSSAGAWRLACMAQKDPVSAIERLAWHYSRQCYSPSVDRHEVSREARRLLDVVLGDNGRAEIVSNPVFRLHIVADRARGMVASDRRRLLGPGLLACALSNAVSRRNLRWYFERVIFYNAVGGASAFAPDDLPTCHVPLTETNLHQALMASGSIPGVMAGVSDIPGAPPGVYRDGGITDYHFDLPFHRGEGLVLYPHFYSSFTAGWFDKMLPWRRVNADNFSNVLLLAPSAQFVSRLPGGRIPDRKDFETLDDATRFARWQTALRESERLAEDFDRLLNSGDLLAHIKPLRPR